MKVSFAAVLAFSWMVQIGAADSPDQVSADKPSDRATFTVPTLTTVRSILAQLEAPIISTLTERSNIQTSSDLYANNGNALGQYLSKIEPFGRQSGRYDYGKLEYPFTLPFIKPDHVTAQKPFPPGTFHQGDYNANTDLFSWYVNTLVPTFNAPTSFFYHLDGSQANNAAALNLDATLLALISHRCYIGQVVAESKYAADVSTYTTLIQAKNATGLRTLLTNTTQEEVVLQQAGTAATAFSTTWIQSGAAEPSTFPDSLQTAAGALFRELIDVTTDIEIQYLLQRFN